MTDFLPMPESDVLEIVKELPGFLTCEMVDNPRILVAGGFCRAILAGETPKDVDVWTPIELLVFNTTCGLVSDSDHLKLKASANAWNVVDDRYPYPVSFVTCYRPETPQDCLEHFDFTVCQACIWFDGKNWVGLVGPRFYRDLAARRLVVNEPGLDSPMGTMERMCRYVARGYRITKSDRAKIGVAINGMNIEDISKHVY